MNLTPNKIADPQSGLLLVNKPMGWTSHDVVNFVRRRFGFKKVGHCGTLDPAATGLLILVVGHATKIAAYLSGDDKEYRAVMTLGQETDSQDSDGEVTAEFSWDHVTEEQVKEALQSFEGEQGQIPPMVSAVKKGGKKLYELARKGIEIEREPRKITINSIAINEISLPEVNFTVSCSKGTYVRTLCYDMGKVLNSGAYMSALVRTSSGGFQLNDALEVADMKTWELEDLLEHLIPLQDFLKDRAIQVNS